MPNDPALEAAVRAAEARFYAAMRRLHLDGPGDLLTLWADRDEVTTMNAAGGHERGQTAVAGRWTWWAGQGRPMPAEHIEPLAIVVTPALAYTAALEHHGDRVLRVTHVWTPEAGEWKLLHRHADPLVAGSRQ
jgi:ketosteroid isomerase-like protein